MFKFAFVTFAIILLIIALWAIHARRLILKATSSAKNCDTWKQLATTVCKASTANELMEKTSDWLSRLIVADSYHVFVRDHRSQTLVLRHSRSTGSVPKLSPQYTSLLESATNPSSTEYSIPEAIHCRDISDDIAWHSSSRPFYHIPFIADGYIVGVALVGPIGSDEITPAHKRLLSDAKSIIAFAFKTMLELEQAARTASEMAARADAGSIMVQSSMGSSVLVEKLLCIARGGAEADAGFILSTVERETQVIASDGFSSESRHLIDGFASHTTILELANACNSLFIATNPSQTLLSKGYITQWVLPLKAHGKLIGAMTCLCKTARLLTPEKAYAMSVLGNRIAMIIENNRVNRMLTNDYLDMLLSVVNYTDSLHPTTQGSSARVSRFAKELALAHAMSELEVEALALASRLHDIGMADVLGLVTSKKGRLTAEEYELVKNHPVVGSLIVEPICEPMPLAPLVRHHHERWDGWGYPDGLTGEAIPLGARIIAIADTFNAMVSSRTYRTPMRFELALEALAKLGGTQLDPELVRKFISMWQDRRRQAGVGGYALEDCRDMLQLPEHLCQGCPALMDPRQCWTVEGVLCKRHNNSCDTCMVKTECESRPQFANIADRR